MMLCNQYKLSLYESQLIISHTDVHRRTILVPYKHHLRPPGCSTPLFQSLHRVKKVPNRHDGINGLPDPGGCCHFDIGAFLHVNADVYDIYCCNYSILRRGHGQQFHSSPPHASDIQLEDENIQETLSALVVLLQPKVCMIGSACWLRLTGL